MSLGPTLEVLHLPHIYDAAQKHGINIDQYEDDTQLYLAFNMDKQEEAIAKMKDYLSDSWIKLNKLTSPMRTRQSSSSSLQQDMPTKSQ